MGMLKKQVIIVILQGFIIFCLSSCGHKHTFVAETCILPQVCEECGYKEGEALGHDWLEADCEKTKICNRCGATEGEALGHDWLEADCKNPMICIRCNSTNGDALGHTCEVGLCERCNVVQNQKLLKTICEYFNLVIESGRNVREQIDIKNVSTNLEIYEKIKSAELYLETVKENLEKILDICNQYQDLSEMENEIKIMLNLIPSKLNGSDVEDLSDSITEYIDFMEGMQNFIDYFENYVGKLIQ